MHSDRIKNFTLLTIAIFCIICLALLLSSYLVVVDTHTNRIITELYQPPQSYRHLDGQPAAVQRNNLRPVAVIIENHVESRPVSGLDQASIVYEVIVEGDITRYLAIFDYDFTAERIGPVRSVRPFFVDLAEQWDVVLFHAGGSTDGLAALERSPLYGINEISGDGIYFWRDLKRQPPHNLYISANSIKRAIAAKDIATSTAYVAWRFKDSSALAAPTAVTVPVDFSSNTAYRPVWQYNSQTNDYTRFVNDAVDKTDQGVFLKTKNLVIQYVSHDIVDDYGRLDINVTDGGVATMYYDGGKVDGTWKTIDGKTRFFDGNGNEVLFNRGKMWIELVFD